ncbi:MAG: MinD/ParA family protein [Azonexus sp.]|nr:MinD/ParA family protein [Azonexus sp.]
MADFHVDQAAGLRRLLGGGRQLQVVTFVAGCEGVGRSLAVANLGAALARLGKEVLIIDEHAAQDDIAASFGLMARFDLLDVVHREVSLDRVLLQPFKGLCVLPAARAVRKLGRLSPPQQQALLDAMAGLERPLDVILVDASAAHAGGFSPFSLAAQETVMVVSGSSNAITEAYALIKKASQAFARRHFRILVNKVKSRAEARAIFDNIAQVAAKRGIARLDYAGAIPLNDALRQSFKLARPVLVEAPDSVAAAAFRDLADELLYWQGSDGGSVEHFIQQLLHLSQRTTPNVLRA